MNIYYDVEDNHYRTYPDGDIATVDQMKELIENKDLSIVKLQQENKQLKERIEYLERSNNRREDTILEQQQEISNLEDTYCDRTDCSSRIKDSKKYDSLKQKYDKQVDNWNKLKEWVNKYYDYYMKNKDYIGGRLCFTDMKNKMQEIEGSDNK